MNNNAETTKTNQTQELKNQYFLDKEDIKEIKKSWKNYLKETNGKHTFSQHLAYIFLTGKPFEKSFSPITNINKLNNGQTPYGNHLNQIRYIFGFTFKTRNVEEISFYKIDINLNKEAFFPFKSVLEKYSEEKIVREERKTWSGTVIPAEKNKIIEEKQQENFLKLKKSIFSSYMKSL